MDLEFIVFFAIDIKKNSTPALNALSLKVLPNGYLEVVNRRNQRKKDKTNQRKKDKTNQRKKDKTNQRKKDKTMVLKTKERAIRTPLIPGVN